MSEEPKALCKYCGNDESVCWCSVAAERATQQQAARIAELEAELKTKSEELAFVYNENRELRFQVDSRL